MAEMMVVMTEMNSLLAEVIHLGYVVTEMFESGPRLIISVFLFTEVISSRLHYYRGEEDVFHPC